MRISNENRIKNSTMKELQTRNIELEKRKRERERDRREWKGKEQERRREKIFGSQELS